MEKHPTSYLDLVRQGHLKTQALKDRIRDLESVIRDAQRDVSDAVGRVTSNATGYESEYEIDLLSNAAQKLADALGE